MGEKKIVYEMIIDIWNLAKKFEFEKLTDEQWEEFVDCGNAFRTKFMKHGKNIDLLCRGLFLALQNYYERLNE